MLAIVVPKEKDRGTEPCKSKEERPVEHITHMQQHYKHTAPRLGMASEQMYTTGSGGANGLKIAIKNTEKLLKQAEKGDTLQRFLQTQNLWNVQEFVAQ